jgi:hypothetical protein
MAHLTVPALAALLTIPWWCWYFHRVWRIVRNGYFMQMPRFYMSLHLYGIGLLYYFAQYEPEQQIQTALAWTQLPLTSWLKTLISPGLISLGYIVTVRRYTRFTISYKIDAILFGVMLAAILTSLILYEHIPYLQIQVIVNVALSCGCLMAAGAVLPMFRTLFHSRPGPIREAHYLWMSLFLATCGCAAALLLLDGVYKLLTGQFDIYSPLYTLCVVCQNLYMVIVAILVGPDQYLDWIYYPRKWLTYRRLQRLTEQIQREATMRSTYDTPLPRNLTLSGLDFNTYHKFIVIMDSYPYLPPESPLARALQAIANQNAPYEDTIARLEKLGAGGWR